MDLRHLRAMTDDTGLLQHAAYSIPRYDDGYCLDDNARGLLLMALVADAGSADDPVLVSALSLRYLAFVNHAFNRSAGRFRNFFSYSRQWQERQGSEDSHGRAVWGLGAVVGRANDPGKQSLAGDLFQAAVPTVTRFSSPRAWAYTLLGIDEYLRAFQGDSTIEGLRVELSDRLLEMFHRTSREDWPWFEDSVTYCNARLSQAMIVTGASRRRQDMIDAGIRSLEWLSSVQSSPGGHFAAIGSNGFYSRGALPAEFDQQPVEACGMVSACLDALRVTGNHRWTERGRRAFNWFMGQNHLHQWLYDTSTGGCRDGVHAERVNQNQGAEATLSFLMALCDMQAASRVENARTMVVPEVQVTL